ncbi:cyclic pyranopterin phosphate synthase [Pectinatus brassicae]|uniref:Cyclic pyranopterin monophosphate synthase n=1 Tax=Pectinatus brassicae TaxID=862415 RepID=A0A840UEZ2_9FIRM|nr:cyclic pyranopterin monophosphate synthase MoaC [Pectinatus brassicae]MBB5335589.1 cyclic pyranopterin phosphate synthase [Pectinatus brassicae]
MNKLSHFDENGQAIMVDVSNKPLTARTAIAEGRIYVNQEIFAAIEKGTSKKGDILGTARLAGIMAAKKTSEIIPLCHPIFISKISISFKLESKTCSVYTSAETKTTGQTGIEMEALHAVTAVLLTIYDMCKAIDHTMKISDIRLIHKTGGKSGTYNIGDK